MDQKEAKQKAESAYKQFFKNEIEKVLHSHVSKPDEFQSAEKNCKLLEKGKRCHSKWRRVYSRTLWHGGSYPYFNHGNS